MFAYISFLLLLNLSFSLPESCFELYSNGQLNNGIYTIDLLYGPNQVYCDMKNKGWILIAKRINTTPRRYFARKWQEYKDGFGDLESSFWTSLDILNMLTMSKNYYLRIDFGTLKDPQYFIEFSLFKIHSENENYKIELGNIINRNIDLEIEQMSNIEFSTEDRDNDLMKNANCAQAMSGGWWFTNCFYKWCLTCTTGPLGNFLWSNGSYLNFPYFEIKMKGCDEEEPLVLTTMKENSNQKETIILLSPHDSSQNSIIIAIVVISSVVLGTIIILAVVVVYLWIKYKRNMVTEQDYGVI